MKWLDIGWEAHGIVAIGQFATGVVAIGQVAWGVVAIGQAAFGWLAVGQLAVGGATIGLVGFGVHGTVAMIGIGGRGRGWVLPLLPSLGERAAPTETRTLADVRLGKGSGWTRLHVVEKDEGRIGVFEGYQPANDVRVDARCRKAALMAAPGDVWVRIRPDAPRETPGFVVEQVVRIDRPRWTRPQWWLIWAAQLTGSMLLAAGVWWGVAEPLMRALRTQ